jgi:hypothetical protein
MPGALSANDSKTIPFCHSTRWKEVLEESSKGLILVNRDPSANWQATWLGPP